MKSSTDTTDRIRRVAEEVATYQVNQAIRQHQQECPAHKIIAQLQNGQDRIDRRLEAGNELMERIIEALANVRTQAAEVKAVQQGQEERIAANEAFREEVNAFLRKLVAKIIITVALLALGVLGAGVGLPQIWSLLGE